MLLLKNVTICAPLHQPELNGAVMDILIHNGRIAALEPHFDTTTLDAAAQKSIKIVELKGVSVSVGWLDVGVQTGDPGLEHREDLTSVTRAAMFGGFTAIATQPNTEPAIHSKTEVLYLRNRAKEMLVDVLPIGAISVNVKGKDMAEILDMQQAGAVAFSDGKKTVQDAGLLLRVLEYAKTNGALVLNFPNDERIAPNGQMHEGQMSTSLGMTGIPTLSEVLMVQRDLQLAHYANASIHLSNISTAESVALVRAAKARGQAITASVAALNLCYDDAALMTFDPNFKVLPPLRARTDVAALVEGLQDGTIDFISSNHTPFDSEAKDVEFPYAAFGAIGLETAFSVTWKYLKKYLSLPDFIDKWSNAPRRVLGLSPTSLKVGEIANLTIFDPDAIWSFSAKDIQSKSKNTPLVGELLNGKVLGVVNKNQWFFMNDE